MAAFYSRNKETIDRAAFFVLVMAGIFVFAKYLFAYLSPFFFGLLIALILEPPIKWLTVKLRFMRGLASMLCLLLLLGAIGGLGTWLVSLLARQAMAFVEAAPLYVDDMLFFIDEMNTWLNSWSDYTFPDIRDTLITWVATVFTTGVRNYSLRIASSTPNFLIGLIFTLVSAFFIMKDRPLILGALKTRCPLWIKENFLVIQRGLSRAVGGYFRAQLILMSIIGIISILGLIILRNPYALLIGIIIAVLDFLPILGSGSVLVPWALYHVFAGDMRQAVGLLALYGVIFITRQVLEPKILSEQIGVHPLVSLMAVFIGYKIFGVIGILLGPAIVMVGLAMREKSVST